MIDDAGRLAKRIADALEYMRLCAPGLTLGEAADVEAILDGWDKADECLARLREVA